MPNIPAAPFYTIDYACQITPETTEEANSRVPPLRVGARSRTPQICHLVAPCAEDVDTAAPTCPRVFKSKTLYTIVAMQGSI